MIISDLGFVIIVAGPDIRKHQSDLLEDLMEGELDMNPYYGHQATFGDDWKVEKRLEREEKVKGAQSYKRKNQYHPAFRK